MGNEFVKTITTRVGWITEMIVYPGDDELQALAEGAIRILSEERLAKY